MALNIRRLQAVKAQLMAEGSAFDMRTYGDEHSDWCGTAACIAGWAARLVAPDMVAAHDVCEHHARPLLGLDLRQSAMLFHNFGVTWQQASQKPVAARCIDNLCATGEVDWPRAVAETGAAP